MNKPFEGYRIIEKEGKFYCEHCDNILIELTNGQEVWVDNRVTIGDDDEMQYIQDPDIVSVENGCNDMTCRNDGCYLYLGEWDEEIAEQILIANRG